MRKIKELIILTFFLVVFVSSQILPQQNSAVHTRGKLWETLYNWGFIGDPGAWDYNEVTGIGFYPGFPGFIFPNDEIAANGFITDANFHNFRSGPWIIAKDAQTLTPPAFQPEMKDFLIYHSSLATGENGALVGNIEPFERTENYVETTTYNPQLPEEMNYVEFQTSTGITVKQRSSAFSFPGYSDFIIYDYTFTNTGDIAIQSAKKVLNLQQTLNEVWFVFHSGIQVSTKGTLNFHYNPEFLSSIVPAGGFGWHPGSGYTDFYVVENENPDSKGLLYYSRDYNGGRNPVSWDQYGFKSNWQKQLTRTNPQGQPYTLPELQDPSAFGFTFLYRTPPKTGGDPLEADPNFFNIYSDEGDKFNGKGVDFEGFGLSVFGGADLYQFARHNKLASNNGHLYCWYTSSFGPYTLAPGDSIRLIVAEIAGTLDLQQVISGDPNHWLKDYTQDWQHDSLTAAMHRNVAALRNAFKWGFGASINGINIAADVPDSPPAPLTHASNASRGTDTAVIAIRWDKAAENTVFHNSDGSVFYDGSTDLSGYRIFRGADKRGIWDTVAVIPRSELSNFWNEEKQQYEYNDIKLQFGFQYYYYVQAYYSNPKHWVSANGTPVDGLPELVSGDYNRSRLTGAKPGPVDITGGWDVFVAPNPYIEGDPERSFPGDPRIEFRKLPERAVVKIYSVSGDLIRTLTHGPDSGGNLSGSIEWNQRSESGLLVAPGLYLYVIESETEGTVGSRTHGKLMIIR